MYGEIFIPKEVFNEIEVGENKEFFLNLSEIVYIKIDKIKNEKSLSDFINLNIGRSRGDYFG